MSYKLSEYVTLFENNGYDNTDFLLGISVNQWLLTMLLVEPTAAAPTSEFILVLSNTAQENEDINKTNQDEPFPCNTVQHSE